MRRRVAIAAWAAAVTLLLAAGCGGENSVPDSPPTTTGEQVSLTPTAPAQTPTPLLPTPEPTPIPAASVPIIDLHFHPEPSWGDVAALFDQIGVQAAGNGASGPDSLALELAGRYPGRVIAFGGGYDIRQLVLRYGAGAWNLEREEVERFLQGLEAELQAARFEGIGEIHVNNWNSNIAGSPQYRYPADSPLLQRLLSLSAAYKVPVSVHMDAEAESVLQMERLLASNREGMVIWAHTGHFAEPDLLRRLLATHPNLYCELSYRTSISGSRTAIPIDTNGRLKEAWKDLLDAFSDRFVIGTDLGSPSPAGYGAMIGFWRRLLEQLTPQAAAKIAYRNAENLLNSRP
jgi:Tat protein secretion system quality control protein TatD with DNase activity